MPQIAKIEDSSKRHLTGPESDINNSRHVTGDEPPLARSIAGTAGNGSPLSMSNVQEIQ